VGKERRFCAVFVSGAYLHSLHALDGPSDLVDAVAIEPENFALVGDGRDVVVIEGAIGCGTVLARY